MAKSSLQSTNSEKMELSSRDRWRESSLFAGLQVLMVLLPIIFTTLTVDQFALPKFVALQVGTVLLIAYWIINLLTASQFELRRTNLDILVAVFFVWILVSTAFSLNITTSILGKYNRHEALLTYVWYFSLFFLSANVFRRERRIGLHLRVMVLVAVVVSVYGLLQYVNIDIFQWTVAEGSVSGQSMSTFGNRSFLAGFLAMILPLSLALFFTDTKPRRILLSSLLLFLVFIGLLTTLSRGAWIGTALGLFLFFILAANVLVKKRQHIYVLAVMVLLIVVVAFAFGLSGEVERLASRISSIFEPGVGSAAIRTEIWKSAVMIVAARPATGSGPEAFRLIFPRFQTLRYAQLRGGRAVADDAHNYYLQIAATLGLPALAIFLAIVLVVFGQGIRLVWREQDSSRRLLFSGLLGGILAYLVHLLFTVSNIATTAWLWVIFGIVGLQVSTFQSRTVSLELWHFSRKLVMVFGAVVLVFIGTWMGLRIFVADFHFAEATELYGQRNLEGAIGEFEQAIRLNPYSDTYWKEMGIAYFNYSRATSDPEALKKAVDAFKRALRMNPLDIENNLLLAEAYTFGGKQIDQGYFDSALEVLNRSLELRPYSSIAYYFLGEIHFLNGNVDEAIRYLEQATTIDPGLIQAQKLLQLARKQKATEGR